jgi:hypothetical protein
MKTERWNGGNRRSWSAALLQRRKVSALKLHYFESSKSVGVTGPEGCFACHPAMPISHFI